jgi:multicomponent Na+:H+ antiporter subunit D
VSSAWAVIAPLLGALLAFLLPRAGPAAALAAGAGVWAAAVEAARAVVAKSELRHVVGGWAAPLGIELRVDGPGAAMLLLTALVMSAAGLYAAFYFRRMNVGRRTFFWPLWMFLWTALNALFVSGDLFNLYVALELLGISAAALAALELTPGALAAATRYLLAGFLASLCFLAGVGILYATAGTLDLRLLGDALAPGPAAGLGAALVVGGLLLKTAVFPLHFWLPPAHARAPAPVSAALSAVVVKGSFFLLFRVWFDVFPRLDRGLPGELLAGLGAGAILWGSVQALRQERLKLLVAYSTVAQVGYLLLAFPLIRAGAEGARTGCLYWALSHGVAKAGMFLAAGNVMKVVGHDRLGDLAKTGLRGLGISAVAFLLAGVSLAGLPPSGGFVAKWMLLTASIARGAWALAALLVLGGLLTAAYTFRLLRPAFAGGDAAPRNRPSRVLQWTALGLSLGAIALGFASAPVVRLLEAGP